MAFTLLRGDGRSVAWGDPTAVRGADAALKGRAVKQMAASARAFAAVMEDGSVVSWGTREFGSDSYVPWWKLHGVCFGSRSLCDRSSNLRNNFMYLVIPCYSFFSLQTYVYIDSARVVLGDLPTYS